ncbi:MAG: aminoglycoside 6-adenylyltransferase [Clostridia bacterium]|nr:aminoglycoside 6-adenylyltransferase [Clostridia bacterium]
MRNENIIYSLILDYARNDERIRAVELNGSRANKNAKKDIFRDFDIIYYVTDVKHFTDDRSFIAYFGNLVIMQCAEDQSDFTADDSPYFHYLMQFDDGNRIDLTFYDVTKAGQKQRESLSIILLDKDNILDKNHISDERDYFPKKPSREEFHYCTNEFWWVSIYVAKGICRKEEIYAKTLLDQYVRAALVEMLEWYIGTLTSFSESPGKLGKNYERLLGKELYQKYLDTYCGSDLKEIWDSLFLMCELFRKFSKAVADSFSFIYPDGYDRNVTDYLARLKNLPDNPTDI